MKLSLATASAAFAVLTAAAPTQQDIESQPIDTRSEFNNTLAARTDAPFGNKKGLAYNQAWVTDVLSRPGSATWAYNWGTWQGAPRFQQIPMCWGKLNPT
jgi:hypothetical protein